MKYTKEVKVGILVLLGLLCLVFGINFLKSKNLFSTDNEYFAKFKYSAGLVEGSAVTINNLKVGVVNKVSLEPHTAKIIVKFSVDRNIVFSKKTKAEIYTSFMGGAVLQVHPVFDDKNIAQSGDTLTSSIRAGVIENITTQLDPTQKKINLVLDNVNQLVSSLNTAFNPQMISHIQKSSEQINQATVQINDVLKMLNKNINHIESVIQNVDVVSKNVAEASSVLKKEQFQSIVEQTQNTLSQAEKILSSIEKGDGTVGKLLNDKQLYLNLNQATQNLSLLLEDIRQHPSRYVNFSVFPSKDRK